MSPKRAARMHKFKELGNAISQIVKLGDPNAPDYHTGKPSKFHMSSGDTGKRDIYYGPLFQTPQWIRTVK